MASFQKCKNILNTSQASLLELVKCRKYIKESFEYSSLGGWEIKLLNTIRHPNDKTITVTLINMTPEGQNYYHSPSNTIHAEIELVKNCINNFILTLMCHIKFEPYKVSIKKSTTFLNMIHPKFKTS